MPADLETAAVKARLVDKAQCTGAPCGGNPRETECGGPGRLLAYQYSCDPPLPQTATAADSSHGGGSDAAYPQSGHNPALSYSMRIDIV